MGTGGDVTVNGPAGFRQRLATSATLSGLASGTYTVVAGNVLSASMNFIPQPATQQVTVGNGTASATVTYGTSQPFALTLQEVASGLAFPVFLTAPANDARLFIVERSGRIRIMQGGTLLSTPFLDISALTTTDGERGLLSMAFDPAYAANGRFYVYYTDTAGNIAIARYQVSASNANIADPAATVLLTIPHPNFSNHNGGLLAFGPDGMLYLGTGDGGGTGDPAGNAQNLGSLLGKLLRIDVRSQPYAIPSDNPFANQAGRRGEIWASGLRNPWRFAFDRTDGTLYIADVGEAQREEIDVVASSSGGQDYGWNRIEGSACFGAPTCSTQGTTLPQLEYSHDANGGCAVVGGYVYRGNAMPALRGRYLYSDLSRAAQLRLPGRGRRAAGLGHHNSRQRVFVRRGCSGRDLCARGSHYLVSQRQGVPHRAAQPTLSIARARWLNATRCRPGYRTRSDPCCGPRRCPSRCRACVRSCSGNRRRRCRRCWLRRNHATAHRPSPCL